MFSRSGDDVHHEHFQLDVATDIRLLDDVVRRVSGSCFAGCEASPRTQFRLCTVVAEAVANAMLYGNDGDPARRVSIDVRLTEDTIVIAVADEGAGFNHTIIPLPTGDASLADTRGRGLFMIHRLSDAVEFNTQGNTIWMTLPRR